ncbi:hypothetical protein Tco_0238881, partial [Tanacetum coccineum]
GGQGVGTLIVSEAAEVVAEDVILLRSKQSKRKTIVDAGEPSHPAKKLRDDHGDPGGPSVAGKSRSAVQRLLDRAVLNAEVRDSSHHSGANIAEAEVDSIARSSAPIIATVVTATADVAATAKEAPAKPSLFAA